ncbi:MAG: hypothetical protein AAF203_07115, partial [Pseudomonadota bacterium]
DIAQIPSEYEDTEFSKMIGSLGEKETERINSQEMENLELDWDEVEEAHALLEQEMAFTQ